MTIGNDASSESGLIADDAKRSRAARLRDVMPDIEKSLDAGYTLLQVFEVLVSKGFQFNTFSAFKASFYRIKNGIEIRAIKKGEVKAALKKTVLNAEEIQKPIFNSQPKIETESKDLKNAPKADGASGIGLAPLEKTFASPAKSYSLKKQLSKDEK